ncbi:hypothetical protein D3C74_407410 [compost metagenome]
MVQAIRAKKGIRGRSRALVVLKYPICNRTFIAACVHMRINFRAFLWKNQRLGQCPFLNRIKNDRPIQQLYHLMRHFINDRRRIFRLLQLPAGFQKNLRPVGFLCRLTGLLAYTHGQCTGYERGRQHHQKSNRIP